MFSILHSQLKLSLKNRGVNILKAENLLKKTVKREKYLTEQAGNGKDILYN